MIVTVRGISDWLKAWPVLLLTIPILCGSQAVYGQQKTETPQQTNAKISELATLARTQPHDAPVGSGDTLHVDVFDVPELSRDLRVSETGDVSYPLIPGRIHASGLTPYQLEQKLSVFVKEQNSQPVSIVGAIVKPGVIQIIRPTTLLELLADSGGIQDDAGSYVIVTRRTAPPEVKEEATVATAEPPPVTPPDELTQPSQIITI